MEEQIHKGTDSCHENISTCLTLRKERSQRHMNYEEEIDNLFSKSIWRNKFEE